MTSAWLHLAGARVKSQRLIEISRLRVDVLGPCLLLNRVFRDFVVIEDLFFFLAVVLGYKRNSW